MAYTSTTRSSVNPFRLLDKVRSKPGLLFGLIIITALIFFEMFNYSTTDYALRDLLGGLKFAGMPWATILAVAFCGIDFAGIARLFTPEQGSEEPKEVWYLFGAWLLAATMNAILTWWGVSIAVTTHTSQSSSVLDPKTVNSIVPIFVAIMVWVIRILIIGSLSVAGDRIFSSAGRDLSGRNRPVIPARQPANTPGTIAPRPAFTRPVVQTRPENPGGMTREPTYHSLSAGGRGTPPRSGGMMDPRK